MTAHPPVTNGRIALDAVEQLDRRQLRGVLGRFTTGVTVVTVGGPRPHGMTANAFTSVSLSPPLVLVCVGRTARLHDAVISVGGFGISMLAAGQQRAARYFADAGRPSGYAQFSPVGWSPGARTGAPLLHGALAWLECSLTEVYAGGDHSIMVGELVSVAGSGAAEPLVFHGGQFHHLGERMTDDQLDR